MHERYKKPFGESTKQRALWTLCLFALLLTKGCGNLLFLDCRYDEDCAVSRRCLDGYCKPSTPRSERRLREARQDTLDAADHGQEEIPEETHPDAFSTEPTVAGNEHAEQHETKESNPPEKPSPEPACRNWKLLRTFAAHKEHITQVAFKPAARLLATASEDATIKLWVANANSPTNTLQGHSKAVRAIVWGHDGGWLASAGDDRTIKFWDPLPPGGTVTQTLTRHTSEVRTLALAPGGALLASGDARGNILLWTRSASTWRHLRSLHPPNSADPIGIHALAYASDGRLASALTDGRVVIWRRDGDSYQPEQPSLRHPSGVRFLAFSPDGSRLVTSTQHESNALGKIFFWDLQTPSATPKVLKHPVSTTQALAHAPRSELIATLDKSVHLWELPDQRRLQQLPAPAGVGPWEGSLQFSTDGALLAAAYQSLSIWECQRCPSPGEKETCYSGKPDTRDVGACSAGVRLCQSDGLWSSCQNQALPTAERCNGKDDDCDGVVDEGFEEVGKACQLTSAFCQTPGKKACSTDGTQIICQPTTAFLPDVCDGLDNDCDGQTDEPPDCKPCQPGERQPCHPQRTSCASAPGKLQCRGLCKAGTQTCLATGRWGVCSGSILAQKELCNDKDDDCDGSVDEDFVGKGLPCFRGQGSCKRTGKSLCTGDGSGLECDAKAGNPSTESCDGLDNDCDGKTDEEGCGACQKDQTKSCFTGNMGCLRASGQWICQGTCQVGTQRCLPDGSWSGCQGDVVAQTESCNDKDDDCNGLIDDLPSCPRVLFTPPRFHSPVEVAIDTQGNLYTLHNRSSNQHHQLVQRTPQGHLKTLFHARPGYRDGPAAQAKFQDIRGLATDATGNLYLADAGNYRIRKLDTSGNVTTIAGTGSPGTNDGPALTTAQFSAPRSLAVDKAGNLYIVDNNALRKLAPTGQVTTIHSSLGGGRITVDEKGNIYIGENLRIRKLEPSGKLSTIAGSASIMGKKDGPGDRALFNSLGGLVSDQAGTLYVADTGNQAIRKLKHVQNDTCDGQNGYTGWCVSTIAGTGIGGFQDGVTGVRFANPTGLTLDRKGNLLIADKGNHRIRKLETSGKVMTVAYDPPGWRYHHIARDHLGHIFLASRDLFHIDKFDAGGTRLRQIGSSAGYKDGPGTQAQFREIWALATDSLGNLLIADKGNRRIRKLDTSGNVTTIAGTGSPGTNDGPALTTAQFSAPRSLAVDKAGNLYIGDASRIRKLAPTGQVTTVAGSRTEGFKDGPATQALFDRFLHGLVVGTLGQLYIADNDNHRIRKLDAFGMVTTYAGTSTAGFRDGVATQAEFHKPRGLALDARTGCLYIADTINHKIRKRCPNGLVTSIPLKGSEELAWDSKDTLTVLAGSSVDIYFISLAKGRALP